MANVKSAEKRARQALRRKARNDSWDSSVKTFEKKVLAAVKAKKGDDAQKALVQFMSQIDKAAKKGVYHARKAARKIGRLSKQVATISK